MVSQEVLKTASSRLLDFQNQIRDRKAKERQIDRVKALNENIIKSGKLLQDYIGAQASYQQSLSQQKRKYSYLASKQRVIVPS